MMKIKRNVFAAEDNDKDTFGGTQFYKISEEDLKKYFEDDSNIVMRYVVATQGFDAFDTDSMWGSYYDRATGNFYYCNTDGQDIMINGEEIDPESALDEYSIEDVQEYVVDGTDSKIRKYFTEYELKPVDIDEAGQGLIEDGYSFSQIIEDMKKLDAVDL